MDTIELARATAALPLTVLLMFVLIGGYMGWWIYGSLHRSAVEDLRRQLVDETTRADRWEKRFLEVNPKLDQIGRETRAIGSAVGETATAAADKLTGVEAALADLRKEMTEIKARGQHFRQGDA